MYFSLRILAVMVVVGSNMLNAVAVFKLRPIIDHVLCHLNQNHASIFISSPKHTTGKQLDEFFKNLNTPITTIATNAMNAKNVEGGKLSEICIILGNVINEVIDTLQTQYTLDRIAKISPIQPRPKCLLLLFRGFVLENNYIQTILMYAWFLKFLDFTILVQGTAGEIIQFNYNPFSKTINTGNVTTIFDIFPDKRNNVKRYKLRLMAFDAPPFIKFNTENGEIKVSGTNYYHLETIARKLNFQIQFVNKPRSYIDLNIINEAIYKLENNEVSISTIVSLLGYSYGKLCVIGRPVVHTKKVFVVPVRLRYKIYFSGENLIIVISFLTSLIFFTFWSKLLNFSSSHWNIMQIYQLYLGISVSQPRKNAERIIFFLIVLLSIKYSSVLFSMFADLRLMYEEEDFKSVDDLINSGMTVYRFDVKYYNSTLDKLFASSIILDSIPKCVNKVITTKNAMCVLVDIIAEDIVEKSNSVDKIRKIKIAGPSFDDEVAGFIYEKASPFAVKIEQILQSLDESGLSDWGSRKNQITTSQSTSRPVRNSTNIVVDVYPLVIPLGIGCSIAGIVFIFELLYTCSSSSNLH